ncbi:MAG: pyridoxamine 5'-phosphate oxidase family protein [Phototrophicaceae bacterium]
MTPEAVVKAVYETIEPLRLCFLITNNEVGHVSSRLMQCFKPEPDFTIWFGTRDITRKVSEIRADARASVSFHNSEENAYVTFTGSAEIVDDLALRQQYWRPDWKQFFLQGPEEGYLLIKFTPVEIEVLNFARDITPHPYGIQPCYLFRVGDEWSFNESTFRGQSQG